jgi:hypothetical protein
MCLEDCPIPEPNATGIDIGAREIFVAVPPDRDEDPVRVFSAFTADLALKQSRKSYLHDQEQIAACNEEAEKLLVAFELWVDPGERPLPPNRKKKPSGRKRNVNPNIGIECRATANR